MSARPSQHGTHPTVHLHEWKCVGYVEDDGWPKAVPLHPVGRTIAFQCTLCGDKRVLHSEITPGVS